MNPQTVTVRGITLTRVGHATRAYAVDRSSVRTEVERLKLERTPEETLELDALGDFDAGLWLGAEQMYVRGLPARLNRVFRAWREELIDEAVKGAKGRSRATRAGRAVLAGAL